ncbi:hypothetical protein, partial [Thioclava pacifica]|uniref:hypothetical protein n=1 Tax=Thioclava pacifica TaxID=285109 RepID=UPI00197E8A8F
MFVLFLSLFNVPFVNKNRGSQTSESDCVVMKKTCHACGEQISDGAKICPVCNSNQNKFLFYANGGIGIGSLVISGLSLVVAFVAQQCPTGWC